MNVKLEQFSVNSPNPVLRVANDGTVLYSNEAAKSLLHEWGVEVGEKLPSTIGELVQRVISRKSPEKIEARVGKRVYLVVFHPVPEEECVNVSGFDISDQKELEEKLLEDEARYRDVFETVQEVFYIDRLIYDEQGNVVDWIFEDFNPAGFELLGLKDINEARGKRGSKVLGREVASFYLPMIEKARQSDKAVMFQYRSPYVEKDFLTSYIVHGDRLISAQMDITERKQMENALQESEARCKVAEAVEAERRRLYDVLETLPIMICLLTSDHHVAFANRSFREKFGEPGGQHCYEFRFGRTKPCEFCESFKVLETGQPHKWEVTAPDGSVLEVHNLPFTDFDGSHMILEMDIDITERKKAEEKLRESEEKYRNIVETSNEGIYFVNYEGKITYANKIMETSGYSLEEIIGRPIWDFISEESLPEAKRSFENRKLGISESYESKLIRKDGSSIWGYISAKPFFSKKGKFEGYLAMLTDITERKKAEEALANLETARKKEIHHRIKNNLQVISSLLDLQAEQFKGRKDIKDSEVLEAFRESQDRVISMALIHEELYRGEEFETLNFAPYIEELAEVLFQTYSPGKIGISLKLDLAENIFFDMDTAVPLGMIINELVSNSFKHAFPCRRGEIRIKLLREENGDHISGIEESKIEKFKRTTFTLTVSDNGVGIPENLDIEDLGTLGMQLVTSLVDQLEGELELKRDNGTEFIIRFIVIEEGDRESVSSIQELFE